MTIALLFYCRRHGYFGHAPSNIYWDARLPVYLSRAPYKVTSEWYYSLIAKVSKG